MNPITFQALGEPNRLNIVELLRTKPHTVNEIVDSLHLNQPQVSKHLKVLADAGLVEVNPVANKRIYAIRPEPLKEIDAWVKKYRKFWEERFDRLDALLEIEKKKLKRGGENNNG
jgi:DNA-binding transcriptional ArsR family regulator